MKFFISNLIIFAVFGIVSLKCVDKSTIQFKSYKINLDEPASQRFWGPSIDFKNEISTLVDAQK